MHKGDRLRDVEPVREEEREQDEEQRGDALLHRAGSVGPEVRREVRPVVLRSDPLHHAQRLPALQRRDAQTDHGQGQTRQVRDDFRRLAPHLSPGQVSRRRTAHLRPSRKDLRQTGHTPPLDSDTYSNAGNRRVSRRNPQ